MSKSWVPGFIALGLVWGASFLFIELALESFTPLGIAFLRGGLGALSLLIMITIMKQKLPRNARHWLHIAVVAMLLNTAPGFLFAVGQQYVSSSIAGILNATTPMMTLLVISLAFSGPTTHVQSKSGNSAGVPWRNTGGTGWWRGLGDVSLGDRNSFGGHTVLRNRDALCEEVCIPSAI